ncbi:hypothetical protein CMQ_3729 [Grosmannia clavigera kw1407]|uniref:Uncharacterized protein n=1 Tax=Grosmannia clavigera (strain kw1407 / UAMH 11150) TaxID=655863 RepID=F0X9J4_GROCL|nr:uncharacterized protein CMQ_3729 [Grosmannia clavigera kw1407]EFX05660.1 hypothetical protein CMQ_3729 [Grosmannia clavigera kw1407]
MERSRGVCKCATYEDLATQQSELNPSIADLARYLGQQPAQSSTMISLDYLCGDQALAESKYIGENDLEKILDGIFDGDEQRHVILVEDIEPRLISLLGEKLDIDPVFFAGHITTNFGDIEHVPPPPSLALLPSQIAAAEYLHTHYQRVMDLGNADLFQGAAYALKTNSNIVRNVRRLPALSGRQLGLAHLVRYLRYQPPPGFTVANPSLLSLCYYPIRISLAEWNLYIHLTSRCVKHYEYTLSSAQNRLHDDDIKDLQRWRRRSKQSQHKLLLVEAFVDHWRQQEADGRPTWDMALMDIRYLRQQLEQYSISLEQMISVATSMVQLIDSRRSLQDAANVKQLTLIALIFVPLSWVASLFSLSDKYAPGHEKFWVYIATALSVLFLVLLLSALRYSHVEGFLKSSIGRLSLIRRVKINAGPA